MNELNNYIKDVKKFLKAPTKFFARASQIGQANVLQHFRNEQGPSGKWQGLSATTIAMRTKGKGKRKSKGILQDNGDLKRSISGEYSRNSARIGSAGVGSSYSRIHNFGGMAGRGKKVKIPKREFLWFDKNSYGQMENAMVSLLEKA